VAGFDVFFTFFFTRLRDVLAQEGGSEHAHGDGQQDRRGGCRRVLEEQRRRGGIGLLIAAEPTRVDQRGMRLPVATTINMEIAMTPNTTIARAAAMSGSMPARSAKPIQARTKPTAKPAIRWPSERSGTRPMTPPSVTPSSATWSRSSPSRWPNAMVSAPKSARIAPLMTREFICFRSMQARREAHREPQC
jgi:hypothetical protein